MLRAHPALLGTLKRREPYHGTETTLHLRHPKINITCGATVIGNEALVSSDHFLVFHTSCRGHAARMINRMRKRHNFVICFCRARTVVAEAVLLSTTYASNALPDSFTVMLMWVRAHIFAISLAHGSLSLMTASKPRSSSCRLRSLAASICRLLHLRISLRPGLSVPSVGSMPTCSSPPVDTAQTITAKAPPSTSSATCPAVVLGQNPRQHVVEPVMSSACGSNYP